MQRDFRFIRLFKAFSGLGWVCVAGSLLWGCAETVEKSPSEVAISAALKEAALSSQKGLDYTAAAAHYKQLYEREPGDWQSLLGYVRNLRYAGQPREAIKTLKEGIKKHGEKAVMLLELGKCQLAASFINDAAETFARVRDMTPDNWDVHSATGIVHDRLGDFEKAQAAYRKSLSLSPGNVAVLNNLALSLTQSGRLDEGIGVLEKVVNSENSTAQDRQNQSVLYALRADFERAERLARQDLPPDAVKENMATYRRFHQ